MTGIASRNTVLVDEPRPGVVLVTLNRPERLNAMNHELVGDLHAVLDQVGADRSCRVVVLTGELLALGVTSRMPGGAAGLAGWVCAVRELWSVPAWFTLVLFNP